MKGKSKVLLVLVAVCVALVCMSVTAFAAGDEVTLNVDVSEQYTDAPARAEGATYKSLEDALDAALNGDTIKLSSNVTSDDNAVFYDITKDITIDLNGYTLSGLADGGNEKTYFIAVKGGAILTICDNSTNKDGQVSATYKANSPLSVIYVDDDSQLILDSGIITHGYANYGAMNINMGKNTTFTMNGGQIKSIDTSGKLNFGVNVNGVGATFNFNNGVISGNNYQAVSLGSANSSASPITFKMVGGEIKVTGDAARSCAVSGGMAAYTICDISEGTIIAKRAILLGQNNQLIITGGDLTGTITGTAKEKAITGGTFSADPSAYVDSEAYSVTHNTTDDTYTVAAAVPVAQIDGVNYPTLDKAVAAADNNDTITILDDIILDKTVIIDKNITLNINNKKICLAYSDNGYDNYDGLRFVGSGTSYLKNGKIVDQRSLDNTSCGWVAVRIREGASLDMTNIKIQGYDPNNLANYNYLVYVRDGGTLTLNNGTQIEVLKDAPRNLVVGETTWGCPGLSILGPSSSSAYTETTNIIINNGVNIDVTGYAISGNGTMHGTDITINGGDITSSGSAAIYHPQAGKLTVNGGKLTGLTGIQLCSGTAVLCSFNGGSVRATGDDERADKGSGDGLVGDGAAISVVNRPGYAQIPTVEITGGSYSSDNGAAVLAYTWQGGAASQWSEAKDYLKISGGYYSSDPSAYVISGKIVVESNNRAYPYLVTDKPSGNVEVVAKAPEVKDPPKDSGVTEAVKEAVANTQAEGLHVTANTIAKTTVNEAVKTDGATKLEAAIGSIGSDKTVTIVVQPYIEITPQSYNEQSNVLTLDITPKYNLIATTADVTDPDNIKPSGGIDGGQNAVVINSTPRTMTVTTDVEISITLPDGFPTDNLYVKHDKGNGKIYYYEATVSGGKATFTVTNGFSQFSFMADTRTGKISYPDKYVSGQEVTYTPVNVSDQLPTASKSGYRFQGWEIDGKTYTALTDDLLTKINGKTLTATPVFSEIIDEETGEYAIKIVDTDNGTVKSSDKYADKGDKITLTIKPDKGYELSKLVITDADGDKVSYKDKGDGKYTFTMPDSKVTVKATFAKIDEEVSKGLPFLDVNSTAWYYEAVKYAYDNELFQGMTASIFGPNEPMTRAMLVTVMYRLEGEPRVTGDNTFSDVGNGTWYTDAVIWANANGIVQGYGNGAFGPMDNITREQLAVILYKYAIHQGMSAVTLEENLGGFVDGAAVSGWAVQAMNWAVGQQLLQGKGANNLDPQGQATRAEVAQILMNYQEKTAK